MKEYILSRLFLAAIFLFLATNDILFFLSDNWKKFLKTDILMLITVFGFSSLLTIRLVFFFVNKEQDPWAPKMLIGAFGIVIGAIFFATTIALIRRQKS